MDNVTFRGDTKCQLSVVFEHCGRKYDEETYPLTIKVDEWLQVKRKPQLYARIKNNCSTHQARLTDNHAASHVIGLVCEKNTCRSLVARKDWSRSLQKHFNDIIADLAVTEYSLPNVNQSNHSSKISSGGATAVKSYGSNTVVTDKQYKEKKSHDDSLSVRKTFPSQSSGFKSLEEDIVPFGTSVVLNNIEWEFFELCPQARTFITSKLEDNDVSGSFSWENDKLKLLLFSETKADLYKAKDIYFSSVVMKIWTLKDSFIPSSTLIKKEEIVSDWQHHFQHTMKWTAWCMAGDKDDVKTIATLDLAKDVEWYIKQQTTKIQKNDPVEYILKYKFQGNKLKLLRDRPRAKDYVAQSVADSVVKFDDQKSVIQLVTGKQHQDKASQFLTLIKTADITVETSESRHLQEELIKRHPIIKHKMMVELDPSESILSITATDDVFDRVLHTCEEIQQEIVITDTYQVTKEVMQTALTDLKQLKQDYSASITVSQKRHDDIYNFEITGCRKGIREVKALLVDVEEKTQRKKSTSRTSLCTPSLTSTNGDQADKEQSTVTKGIQKILSVSDEARQYVVKELSKNGLKVEICSTGVVKCVATSKVIHESTLDILLNYCFVTKLIDFDLFPIGSYLKPSQALEGLTWILGDLSKGMFIDSNDGQNTVRLVFMKDIAERIVQIVQCYIEEYSECKENFTLSREEMKQFWLKQCVMVELERSFSLEKVRIILTGTKLAITGAKIGVKACIEKMRKSNLLPDSDAAREAGKDGMSEHRQIQLSNHMTSLLNKSSSAKAFVENVFDHVHLTAELTSDCSGICISKKTKASRPYRNPLQSSKTERFSTTTKAITSNDMIKTLQEEKSNLAEKLLVHEDNASGRLVVLGSKDAVDVYLQKIRSSIK